MRQLAGAVALSALLPIGTAWASPVCAPGWSGTTLIDGESLTSWTVERSSGASGALQLTPGLQGQAIAFNWDIGVGSWVQAKYTFPQPVDLSSADLFGLNLHGGGPEETANLIGLMFADINDVFYGVNLPGREHGLNQINRWLINLPIPKKSFFFFFRFGSGGTQIDWSRINRLFLVVRKDGSFGGGSGVLTIDEVRYDTAAHWPRQETFSSVTAKRQVSAKALNYLLSQQQSTGLFLSWKEEPSPKSWLYDQALALIVSTREGRWRNRMPRNRAARAAQRLVAFLNSAAAQKPDGHWARGWDPFTGAELVDDGWVGDQAWWIMALAQYAEKSGDVAALASAQRGADWLAAKIDPVTGFVVPSTEGTVDVFWTMAAMGRVNEADRIKNYLLSANTVWDADLRYWWRSANDPLIAMDTATWTSVFSRHPLVKQSERGLAALSFVRKTLVTSSDDGALCGFDGQGPVSLWNEGIAQYVASGGIDAPAFLPMLTAQQKVDGSMPGSPNNWISNAYGWLSSWSGLAPTAWLYFAVKGLPFPAFVSVLAPNGSESWSIGSEQTIRWDSIGVRGSVWLELSRDGGVTWETMLRTANDGEATWRVTGPATTQARVRIRSRSLPTVLNVSDENFRIQ
jgi:hypothetical protein